MAISTTRPHFRALPGEAGSANKPIAVSGSQRALITTRLATAEERAWAALVRNGVPAAEARDLAGLPPLR